MNRQYDIVRQAEEVIREYRLRRQKQSRRKAKNKFRLIVFSVIAVIAAGLGIFLEIYSGIL